MGSSTTHLCFARRAVDVSPPREWAAASSLGHSPQPQFMLVPSLACAAACSYCFGPHQGPTMSPETMESALDLVAHIAAQTRQRKVKVTFHGGEPLLAGHGLWRQALEGLRQRFDPRGYEVGVQSNLWLLDDEFCELFCDHCVDVGTSLDGPEPITDAQRFRAKESQSPRVIGGYVPLSVWTIDRSHAV
jgi:sulfatase maturation enzyme AslB (radical SAM superfamily)